MTPRRPRLYLSLEILRGLCAFEVFLWHCASRLRLSYVETSSWLGVLYESLWRGSNIAVIGFFVISGFVTCVSFQAYAGQYDLRRAALVFYGARILRICAVAIPATLIPFAMVLAYRSATGDWRAWDRYNDLSVAAVVQSAIGWSSAWNPPQWTLRYELVFYAALPFLFLAMFAKRLQVKLVGAIGACAFGALVGLMAANRMIVLHLMTPFLLGMALFAVKDLATLKSFFASSITKAVIAGVALAGIVLSCSLFYSERTPFALDAYVVVALGVLVLVFTDDWFETHRRSFAIAKLSALAQGSYSLYLWHWPILWMGAAFLFGSSTVTNAADALRLYALALPLVALTTWLSWYFIERHARMSVVLAWDQRGTRTTLPSAS